MTKYHPRLPEACEGAPRAVKHIDTCPCEQCRPADKCQPPGFGLIAMMGGVMVCLFVCAVVAPNIAHHHSHHRPQVSVVPIDGPLLPSPALIPTPAATAATDPAPAPPAAPAVVEPVEPVPPPAPVEVDPVVSSDPVTGEPSVIPDQPAPAAGEVATELPPSIELPAMPVAHDENSAANLFTREHLHRRHRRHVAHRAHRLQHQHHHVTSVGPHHRHHWPRRLTPVCASEHDGFADFVCDAARAAGQIE